MVKKITLALLSLLLVPLGMMAQSVTVSPSSGNLIACLSYDTEAGFGDGWSSTWKHEQLPLTFTVKDSYQGEFVPAGNMCAYNNQLVIDGGPSIDLYCELSLPKGYRFKGYKLVLLNNINGKSLVNTAHGHVAKVMYETDESYSLEGYKVRGAYSDNDEEYTMGGTDEDNSDTREYVLERHSQTDTDMGNQLFFRLNHLAPDDGYFGVTIKSFTVYFTAEGTFAAEAKPTSRGPVTSLVSSPFETSKIDIGAVQFQTDGNQHTYYAYKHVNERNIKGYTYIYQDNAIQGDIPMNVAEQKRIHPITIGSTNYYAFENGTYYVEPPILVYSQTGLSYPIGFRVVGAEFIPRWNSSDVASVTQNQTNYYITYTSGGETYYLNDQLRYTTTKFAWSYDSSTKGIYTGSGDDQKWLSCEGSADTRYLTYSYSKPNSTTNTDPGWYDLIVFTRNNRTYIGWDASSGRNRYYLQGTTDATANPTVLRNSYTNAAGWSNEPGTVTLAGYSPGNFTLTIFQKDDTDETKVYGTPVQIDNGTDTDLNKIITVNGFNNDAVKFNISGLPSGKQAIVDVKLKLQALNPYIDKMNINCNLTGLPSVTQEFTAEDFKVSGGEFQFYIPNGYTGDVNFTFSDLWSSYGDNTYYTGSDLETDGLARYSFVTSDYFEGVDEVGDKGLYDPTYNSNASYTNKVVTNKAGNIRFKFNNADKLLNTTTTPERPINYLEEYPFSVPAYVGSANPDASDGKPVGAFVPVTLNTQTQTSGTYYVIVADETRYNIAPSKAWQHRYYAYYRLGINLNTETFNPKYTWTKVYDNTCIWDAEQNKDVDKSMWGLKLNTVASNNPNKIVEGYLKVEDINAAITAALDPDNNTAPASPDQILYVDGSELYTIQSSGDNTLQSIMDKLAPNALFYLPANTTSTEDNFAYKTTTGSFMAGKDIVITDKQPFFAPYAITLDKDKGVARYTREVTWEKYGATTKQSLILPFDLQLSSGTFSSSSATFNVTKLTDADFADDAKKDCVTATFAKVNEDIAPANTPYMVDITSPSDGTFVIEQIGGTIQPTTGMKSDYMFYDTAVGAKYNGADHTFYPRGSFSGKIYDAKEDDFRGSNVFFYYGSKDMFRSSAALSSGYKNLYAYPFRSFYGYSAAPGAKMLSSFMFSYGDEETDGVSDIAKRIDLAVQSGKGYVRITAGKDANVRVSTLNGMQMAKEQMYAGDTRTINLPSGIYIINGMKIIVK